MRKTRDDERVGDGEEGEEESSSPSEAVRSSQQEGERDEGEREGWIQHRARVLPPDIPTLLLSEVGSNHGVEASHRLEINILQD